MAKILTLLVRKLPSLSSTRLVFRCKGESIVKSYTAENGRCFEKECKPERISESEKQCNVEKDCSCVPEQNMSTTSSTLGSNNREPNLENGGSEAPGTASDSTEVIQCKCRQSKEIALEKFPLPEVPTNCCMTGCPNCVWLKFSEDMMKFSTEGGANARKLIEGIEDESLKTFLLLELDSMQKH